MNNLSTHINPANCKGCGKCCEYFALWYDDKNSHLVNSELDRLMLLSGFGDKMRVERVPGGRWLIFDIPCRELLPDKSCAIYQDEKKRPLLCRMFPFGKDDSRCPKVQ